MNFVFVSPQFPTSYWNFCNRLKQRGVTVLGLSDAPYDSLPEQVKNSLTEYYRVDSMEDYDQMVRALGYFTHQYGKIDWLESNNEYWLTQDARLRTDFNITTGMKSDQVANVRRKSAMKAFYKKAGVPTARYHMVSSLEEGLAFAEKVGYPVFVKPDAGMGAEESYKLSNPDEMRYFYETKSDVDYIMEEFITGDIWSYDGISDSKGDIIFETTVSWPRSVADIVNNKDHLSYYTANAHGLGIIGRKRFGKDLSPERLAMLGMYHDCTEIITGDMPTPVKYANDELKEAYKAIEDSAAQRLLEMLPEDLRRAGRATVKAFDVRSRFFHLEFFRLLDDKEGLGKKGDIVALEVNMRPAGGWTPDMYNYANSVDVYSIWADMVVYDKTYVDLNQRKYFAVYAGRRNGKNYIHTPEEIRERYHDQIVMDEDIPEIISGAMGDHMWTARLDTEEQKDEFIDFVQATWQ